MAPLVSPRVLNLVRRLAERAMQDTCSIIDPATPTSDGGGGVTPGTPTRRAALPCALFGAAGDEAAEAVVQVRGRYRLSLPLATAISERNTVEIAGRAFAVVWVPAVSALDVERIVGLSEAR